MGKDKKRRRSPEDVRKERENRFNSENSTDKQPSRDAHMELNYIDSMLQRIGTTEDVNFEDFEKGMNKLRKMRGEKGEMKLTKPLNPDLPEHPYDRYVDPYGDDPVTLHNMMRPQWENRASDVSFIQNMFGPKIVGMVQTALFKYEEAGMFTYELPTELVEMFDQTSLKGITPEILGGLPHECFYVDFEQFDKKIWGDMKTEWHDVSGAFLMEIENSWVWLAWGAENEKSDYQREDAMFSMGIMLDDWKHSGLDLEDYIDKRLDEVKDRIVYSEGGVYESVMTDEEKRDRQLESAWHVFRILINTVLYINTENPEITRDIYARDRERAMEALERVSNPGSKKARLARRDLRSIPASRTHLVAPSIGKKIRTATSSHSPGDGPKKRRHWVRGHWRHQPYWPEGRDHEPVHKTIWIEPHLRGGE